MELLEWVHAGATLGELAGRAGVDRSTIRRRLRSHGVATTHKEHRAAADAARAAGAVTLLRACPRHGTTLHRIDARGSYRCPRCNGERVAARRRRVKELLVADAGGGCVLCGYDRCVRALSFHVDPVTKQFGVAFRGVSRSIARARAEARKCVLLCANCHMEVEAGLATLPATVRVPDPG